MTEPRSDTPERAQGRLRREFLESVHDAILVFRPEDEVVIDVNRRACELYGIERSQFIGMSLRSMTVDLLAGERQIKETLDQGHTRGFESVHVRPDGTRMFVEISATAITVDGRPAVMSVHRDVTERKYVERALRLYTEQVTLSQSIDRAVMAGESVAIVARRAMKRLLESVPDGRASVVLFDSAAGTAEVVATVGVESEPLADGQLISADAWTPVHDLAGQPVRYISDLAEHPDRSANMEGLLQQGLRTLLTVAMSSRGELVGEVTLSSTQPAAFDEDLIAFGRAIADELAVAVREARLRRELTSERERLRVLVEHLPEGVVLLDGGGSVQLSNPAGRALLEVLAPSATSDHVTTLGGHSLSSLVERDPARVEVVVERPSRRVFEVAARSAGESPGFVLLLREATQEHEIRQRMRDHDRLAAVGRLAAGVAHDFNNLLQVITTCSDLALDGAGSPAVVREQIAAIVAQTRRGAQLIRQILDFSRRSVVTFRPTNLGALLEGVVLMLRHSIPETVRIRLDVEPGEHVVKADATQLHQVITNLALNARDAMPAGGELLIRVFRADPSDARLPRADACVCVRVSDEGTGIPAEILPNVFEPFFTTKPPGEGTGLGLSQVYGIVQQHDGMVYVHGGEGCGATFSIYLPLSSEAVDVAPTSERPPITAGAARGVLVVEDDPALRRSLSKLVTTLGYRALTASDGDEGFEVLRSRRDEIDVVLTDLVMPRVGGVEFCRLARRLAPDLPVVVMSGYPLESAGGSLHDAGITEWVGKPFSRERIGAALANALSKQARQ